MSKTKKGKNTELKIIMVAAVIYFMLFLVIPVISLLLKSLSGEAGFGLYNFRAVLEEKGFLTAIGNSMTVAFTSAAVTTVLAFFLAYTVNYTGLSGGYKGLVRRTSQLPMLLPTITYGFAIIYSFGKQGLLTGLLGRQPFEIYGFLGLLTGYVVYTLPVAFLLIHNTMQYIDKRFMVVSRMMGDSPFRTFWISIIRPLTSTLLSAFVQAFFLSFTDFGIPAAVGGKYGTIAGVLYKEMLGSVPDFGRGAVVALVMLLPSVISIAAIRILERYNIRYAKISPGEIKKNKSRDIFCLVGSAMVLTAVISLFAVIFIVPFIKEWPYRKDFTLEHVRAVFLDNTLMQVLKNSLAVSLLTALLGTFTAYGCALITARSNMTLKAKSLIEGIAMVTNTIPGMVLGLSYLFIFSGSPLQGTLLIIIICNIVHYFSTPYLMLKNTLSKLNSSWESTAMLMGDKWVNTIIRVITPNALPTILEAAGYYFINSMVTISAVIFIAGARTMVITAKIKEMQYYNKYNEIFVLSLLILIINIFGKAIFQFLGNQRKRRENFMNKKNIQRGIKKAAALFLGAVIGVTAFTGCSKENKQVIIYSNADDEAIQAMKNALDYNGFKDQYIFQTFGTAELGGKLLAEGTNIEADMVTMSTFYVESAQDKNKMFLDLTFKPDTIDTFPAYCAPITSQEGTVIINTDMMKKNSLPMPASLKELGNPVYKDMISVSDIATSSTAWLLIQGLISAYGEDGAKEALKAIYQNAGNHIEESGSGPLKKIRAGEVAIGFGLRQQAVADKADGLPIDFVDPTEGNFSLTESISVIDKKSKTNKKAMEMAECIIKNGRKELQTYYPNALYNGETTGSANASKYPKVFPEQLTVDLLKKHQELSETCKP